MRKQPVSIKNGLIGKVKKLSAVIILLFLAINADSQGHYMGSSFNPNDYFAPPPGFIIPAYYGYSNMNFYNANGDKSDKLINPQPGNPTSLNISQNVKTSSYILMLIYGAKSKILNANWGFMVIPTLNQPSANIALDYFSNQTGTGTASFKTRSFGLGDIYLQPIWLTWNKPKWNHSVTYGIWAPIGKYKVGDAENVGLGYWSHNLRVASKYKISNQLISTVAATYEFNSKQKGVDFKEASHLTLDYGLAYTMLMGHEIGMFGFYTQQVGTDKGSSGSFLSDKYFGLGMYGSYWIKPGKFGLLARVTQNFGAINRFAGTSFQIGLNTLFLNLSKTP
jgi:hypothetical protein